jgi:thioredoxin 1
VPLTLVPFGAETLRITEFPVLAATQQQIVHQKGHAAAGAVTGLVSSGRSLVSSGRSLVSSGTTLVEFYAPWCTACATVRQSVEAATARLGPKTQVIRVNVDQAPETALRWNVDTLPAFLVFQGEEAIGRRVGVASADELVDLVQKAGSRRAAGE